MSALRCSDLLAPGLNPLEVEAPALLAALSAAAVPLCDAFTVTVTVVATVSAYGLQKSKRPGQSLKYQASALSL
jgi:hypothetical protein